MDGGILKYQAKQILELSYALCVDVSYHGHRKENDYDTQRICKNT